MRHIKSAVITLGAVAPIIIHAADAEAYLAGKEFSNEVITHAAELAGLAAKPIDDIRGSAAYRRAMTRILVLRAMRTLREGQEQMDVPQKPVLLSGEGSAEDPTKPSLAPLIRMVRPSIPPSMAKNIHSRAVTKSLY